jgi:LAS superfamily LD-carboxypeptidase LdcB|tara:strand:- start:7922 stop:9745 length:1824 start_codon:yes stop_codon:yes gene_type:complete
MANLEGKLSQEGTAIYLTDARLYLSALNAELQKAKGQRLNIKQGYVSKYDLTDELRSTLNADAKENAPAEILPLLDTNKAILDIGKNEAEYSKLSEFLGQLATNSKGVFTPTLSEPFSTDEHAKVYPIPNVGHVDPRRYGRLLVFDKFSLDVKKWLTNNAPLYGFAMYEDYGLYFIELSTFKAKATTDTALAKLINQFQRTPISIEDISLKTSTLQKAEDPLGIPLDPVPTPAGIIDNNGNTPDLVRIGSHTAARKIFDDYRKMFIAAKSAGITLKVISGFRPAAGPKTSWQSQSGKTNAFTTQVECRQINLKKDVTIPTNKSGDGKWGPRSGMDYVIYYTNSDTYFQPATASPGGSNHGTGVAIDLNTGSGQKAKNSPVYDWIAKNSWKYGFVRGVSSEEWHYEHWPSLKGVQPTDPFTRVPKTNAKWYNIFANGYDAGTPNAPSDPPTTSQVLLMTGLTRDNSTAAQLSEFRKGYKGTVSQFDYTERTRLSNAIKQNKTAKVVLYSAGAESAKAIATTMKDAGISRSNLYILEPYNTLGPQSGTAVGVKDAVLKGTPTQNVVVGTTTGRGKNILSQYGSEIQGSATNTPSPNSHHTSLKYLGETL